MSNEAIAQEIQNVKDEIKLLRSEYAQTKQWLATEPEVFEEFVGPMLMAKAAYWKGEMARIKAGVADYMLGLDRDSGKAYRPPILQHTDEAMIGLGDALDTSREMREQYNKALDEGKDLASYKEGVEAAGALLDAATNNIQALTVELEEATYGE
jgi:hypothetical protein